MYLSSLDIGNRALQHCGQSKIETVDEISVKNTEVSFAYDKLRRPELRRNVWRFARRSVALRPLTTTTKQVVPLQYSETTNYQLGSLVQDENRTIWISVIPDNMGNTPDETIAWEAYFGPLTADVYDATVEYFAGELVYKAIGSGGGYGVFMSLNDTNTSVPTTADAYDATVTYARDESVSYSGSQWRSLIEVNLAHTPADGPAVWDETAIYASGDPTTGSDGFIYTSVGSANTGHDPVGGGGTYWTNTGVPNAWDRTPEIYASATSWLPLYASVSRILTPYPLGTGPVSDAGSKNVLRLPAGFLRRAPVDPRAGINSVMGVPSNLSYEDADLQGNYCVTSEVNPVIFPFVADITDVTQMDDMFCEGLACRIALAVIEVLTQSSTKTSTIAGEYKHFMTEARLVNAIEVGAITPPLDDWVACRA